MRAFGGTTLTKQWVIGQVTHWLDLPDINRFCETGGDLAHFICRRQQILAYQRDPEKPRPWRKRTTSARLDMEEHAGLRETRMQATRGSSYSLDGQGGLNGKVLRPVLQSA